VETALREATSGLVHGFWLLLLAFIFAAAIVVCICHARLRRLRDRERLAREVEDALVQNAQGLILNVHGIVKKLAENDPLRKRVEAALDRADEKLSEDRDRVQDLHERE
jgi:uncharacterized protein HemX